MASIRGSNIKSPAVKRITREYSDIIKQPSPYFSAAPLTSNIFEWHFTLRGPRDSEFQGGRYHGKLLLPSDYPFSPPDFIFLTPNGRYEIEKKICLSITRWHVEEWQPTWSIRKMLEAVAVFMVTPPEGAVGALDYHPDVRRQLAVQSANFKCPVCDKTNEELLPGEESIEEMKLDSERNEKAAEQRDNAQNGKLVEASNTSAKSPSGSVDGGVPQDSFKTAISGDKSMDSTKTPSTNNQPTPIISPHTQLLKSQHSPPSTPSVPTTPSKPVIMHDFSVLEEAHPLPTPLQSAILSALTSPTKRIITNTNPPSTSLTISHLSPSLTSQPTKPAPNQPLPSHFPSHPLQPPSVSLPTQHQPVTPTTEFQIRSISALSPTNLTQVHDNPAHPHHATINDEFGDQTHLRSPAAPQVSSPNPTTSPTSQHHLHAPTAQPSHLPASFVSLHSQKAPPSTKLPTPTADDLFNDLASGLYPSYYANQPKYPPATPPTTGSKAQPTKSTPLPPISDIQLSPLSQSELFFLTPQAPISSSLLQAGHHTLTQSQLESVSRTPAHLSTLDSLSTSHISPCIGFNDRNNQNQPKTDNLSSIRGNQPIHAHSTLSNPTHLSSISKQPAKSSNQPTHLMFYSTRSTLQTQALFTTSYAPLYQPTTTLRSEILKTQQLTKGLFVKGLAKVANISSIAGHFNKTQKWAAVTENSHSVHSHPQNSLQKDQKDLNDAQALLSSRSLSMTDLTSPFLYKCVNFMLFKLLERDEMKRFLMSKIQAQQIASPHLPSPFPHPSQINPQLNPHPDNNTNYNHFDLSIAALSSQNPSHLNANALNANNGEIAKHSSLSAIHGATKTPIVVHHDAFVNNNQVHDITTQNYQYNWNRTRLRENVLRKEQNDHSKSHADAKKHDKYLKPPKQLPSLKTHLKTTITSASVSEKGDAMSSAKTTDNARNKHIDRHNDAQDFDLTSPHISNMINRRKAALAITNPLLLLSSNTNTSPTSQPSPSSILFSEIARALSPDKPTMQRHAIELLMLAISQPLAAHNLSVQIPPQYKYLLKSRKYTLSHLNKRRLTTLVALEQHRNNKIKEQEKNNNNNNNTCDKNESSPSPITIGALASVTSQTSITNTLNSNSPENVSISSPINPFDSLVDQLSQPDDTTSNDFDSSTMTPNAKNSTNLHLPIPSPPSVTSPPHISSATTPNVDNITNKREPRGHVSSTIILKQLLYQQERSLSLQHLKYILTMTQRYRLHHQIYALFGYNNIPPAFMPSPVEFDIFRHATLPMSIPPHPDLNNLLTEFNNESNDADKKTTARDDQTSQATTNRSILEGIKVREQEVVAQIKNRLSAALVLKNKKTEKSPKSSQQTLQSVKSRKRSASNADNGKKTGHGPEVKESRSSKKQLTPNVLPLDLIFESPIQPHLMNGHLKVEKTPRTGSNNTETVVREKILNADPSFNDLLVENGRGHHELSSTKLLEHVATHPMNIRNARQNKQLIKQYPLTLFNPKLKKFRGTLKLSRDTDYETLTIMIGEEFFTAYRTKMNRATKKLARLMKRTAKDLPAQPQMLKVRESLHRVTEWGKKNQSIMSSLLASGTTSQKNFASMVSHAMTTNNNTIAQKDPASSFFLLNPWYNAKYPDIKYHNKISFRNTHRNSADGLGSKNSEKNRLLQLPTNPESPPLNGFRRVLAFMYHFVLELIDWALFLSFFFLFLLAAKFVFWDLPFGR